MFAYCNNNPVMLTDSDGTLPFLLITAAIGAVVGAVIGGVVAAKSGKNVWAGIGIGAAAGALVGLGAGAAAGAILAGSATASTAAVLAGAGALINQASTAINQATTKVASKTVSSIQTTSSKMANVAAKGKAGEALSGIAKNTKHIPSSSGTANFRIPDGLTDKVLSEVKNYAGTLSYTSQLRDFVAYSQANGLQMHLYTNATLSGPLQQLVDSGVIHLFPLG